MDDIEMRKAAYALNLCTVSVSQIIDYADLNIMDQEYDMILNNLNLEQMPTEDDALLDILKHILDVVTFFRIQDMDKKQIQHEYEQEIKNAIWSAVPSMNVLVAGQGPLSVLSLALSVGSAYMNYRRAKSNAVENKQRKKYELEKAALEQFNGLRRELFTTAWRLADRYKFPDKYRLTENQIHQYNEILMDNNAIRKYERMKSIERFFSAYPPYFYNMANAVVQVATNNMFKLSESDRARLLDEARDYYKKYHEINNISILRTDKLSISASMEYIDLLDFKKNSEEIYSLLKNTEENFELDNDILQICAVDYLKLNKRSDAERVLRVLCNESYNKSMNAQLLSMLYVTDIYNKDDSAITRYNLLSNIVRKEYLCPLPRKNEAIENVQDTMLHNQKEIFRKKCYLAMEKFMDEYDIKYNKVFPLPKKNDNSVDEYFLDLKTSVNYRKEEISRGLIGAGYGDYRSDLRELDISLGYLDVLNDMVKGIDTLEDGLGIQGIEAISKSVCDNIIARKDIYNEIQRKTSSGEFESSDISLLSKISYSVMTHDAFIRLKNQIDGYIKGIESMEAIGIAENELSLFCRLQNLGDIEKIYEESFKFHAPARQPLDFINPYLLGEEGVRYTTKKNNFADMEMIISEKRNEIIIDSKKAILLFPEDDNFKKYYTDFIRKNSDIQKRDILAVLDDKTFFDIDLIFTVAGIVPSNTSYLLPIVRYGSVGWKDNGRAELAIGKQSYSCTGVDLDELLHLTKALDDISR